MKIIKGDKYQEITEALVQTGNYCPCTAPYLWSGENGEDWKCICKAFKEQDTEGHCHCRRFKKIKGEK